MSPVFQKDGRPTVVNLFENLASVVSNSTPTPCESFEVEGNGSHPTRIETYSRTGSQLREPCFSVGEGLECSRARSCVFPSL